MEAVEHSSLEGMHTSVIAIRDPRGNVRLTVRQRLLWLRQRTQTNSLRWPGLPQQRPAQAVAGMAPLCQLSPVLEATRAQGNRRSAGWPHAAFGLRGWPF